MPLDTVSIFLKLMYVHTVVITMWFIPDKFFIVFMHAKGTILTTNIFSTPECAVVVVLTWATFIYLILLYTVIFHWKNRTEKLWVWDTYICYRPKLSTHTLHSNKKITNLLTSLQLESQSCFPILVAQTPSSKYLCLWVYAIVRED